MSNWTEHELGIMEESQGSFSPDILPDEAIVYSRQWWRAEANGTFTVVTYSAAPVKEEAIREGDDVRNDPPFGVDDLLEWTNCTDKDDPGSTELDTGMEWGEGSALFFDSLDDANREARTWVRQMSTDYLHVPHPV